MTARCFMIKRQSVCKSGLWLGGFLMTAGTHHLVLCPARKVFFITTGTHHLALCLARALLRRPTPPRHGRNAQAPLSLQDSLSSVLQESWWQILKSACIVAWLFTRVCGCVCARCCICTYIAIIASIRLVLFSIVATCVATLAKYIDHTTRTTAATTASTTKGAADATTIVAHTKPRLLSELQPLRLPG